MTRKFVVPRERANRDVDEAIEYYSNEDAPQAALGFIDSLEQAYRHIAQHPETGSSRYAFELEIPELRFWPLRKYPHLIFYIDRGDHIDVWRVLHGTRDIPASMQGPESI